MKLFQSHDDTQDTNKFKSFQIPIENSKSVETFRIHNDAPMLKYCHKLFNSFCFNGWESAFDSIEQTKATNAISLRREESLES